MFAVLLQQDVQQDAIQVLLDGVAQGNIVLAIVGGVVLAGLVVLGILKKDHPLVKPLAEAILKVGKTLAAKPKAKPEDQPGAAAVVPIRKLEDEKKE